MTMSSNAFVAPRPLAGRALNSRSFASFYDITDTDTNGNPVDFAQFKGKVAYCVNVASAWGATRREYKSFVDLSKQFGESLTILAFPSGEFGGQELATDSEIAEFARGADFPQPPLAYLMSKGYVNGPNAREAWKLLKEKSGAEDPTWNFKGKFLVGMDGVVSVPQSNVAASIESLMSS